MPAGRIMSRVAVAASLVLLLAGPAGAGQKQAAQGAAVQEPTAGGPQRPGHGTVLPLSTGGSLLLPAGWSLVAPEQPPVAIRPAAGAPAGQGYSQKLLTAASPQDPAPSLLTLSRTWRVDDHGQPLASKRDVAGEVAAHLLETLRAGGLRAEPLGQPRRVQRKGRTVWLASVLLPGSSTRLDEAFCGAAGVLYRFSLATPVDPGAAAAAGPWVGALETMAAGLRLPKVPPVPPVAKAGAPVVPAAGQP